MPISARDQTERLCSRPRQNMLDVPLLLRNQNVPASNGVVFERLSPMTGEVVSRAAAATPADRGGGGCLGGSGLSEVVGGRTGRATRASFGSCRHHRRPRRSVHHGDGRGDRCDCWLGAVQCRACRQHASRSGRGDDADRRRGHTLRQAGNDGVRAAPAGRRGAWNCALECPGHIGCAGARDAACLRQHRDPEGFGNLSPHPPADRREPVRGRTG